MKKLDFYNGNGVSRDVDYSKETRRHIGNNKLGLLIALSIGLVMDVIVAVTLGISTGHVKYFIAPIGLAIVDVLFLVDVVFINLKQKYTVGHRLAFVLLTVALVVVTAVIPTVDKEHRVMTFIAMLIFIGVQAVKTLLALFIYNIDKKSSFAAEDRVWSALLVAALAVMLAFYASSNFNVGVLGQHIKLGDENCTLVYRLTEQGE